MSRTPEFTAQLAPLKQARSEADQARREAYAATQDRQKLGREKTRSKRTVDAATAGQIDQQIDIAGAQAGQAWSAFGQRHAEQMRLLAALGPQLDPRNHIDQFDDSYPILMMPLRIETRFAPDADELWVRVYPDAWAVDGFEEKLSEKELASGQTFWADFWGAAGNRDRQVAAWRNLVASHGTGRAQWIATSFRPANEGEEPAPPAADELLLIVEGTKPPQAEVDAITAYWQTVWSKPDDAAAAQSALADLKTAIGDAAADEAAEAQPRRLLEPRPDVDRSSTLLVLHWIEWPNLSDDDLKAASWTEAARSDILPERLVVTLIDGGTARSEIGNVIPSTVTLGFDPSAPDAEQIEQVDGVLKLPEAMEWIFDFDKAVAMGLGFKIALSDGERQTGFDRILVCGVSLRDDEDESRQALETLFLHHHYSGSGISLLPQGTPTNNSNKPSGYSDRDEVEEAFERMFGSDQTDLGKSDDLEKCDGQWLAEWLGMDTATIAHLPFAGGKDQAEARAMNKLLWPATIGYSLDTLMDDILSKNTVDQTRRYFENYVQARDCIPQIRIDDQPYGILPAGAWSKQRWYRPRHDTDDDNAGRLGREIFQFLESRTGDRFFLLRLVGIMKQADEQFAELVSQTAHVEREGDLHQTLLDILGLAPNSLEFYRRNADSHDQYFNLLRAQGLGGLFEMFRVHLATEAGRQLLQSFGWKSGDTPEILKFIFHDGQEPLSHILVDDVDLSETLPIRAYTDSGENYLKWLLDAGEDSLEALRRQDGFTDDELPRALLYHLARHSLQLSYWDVGMRLQASASGPAEAANLSRREPSFLHIAQSDAQSPSRYRELYSPAPAITGNPNTFLLDHIASVWNHASEAQEYRGVLDGLRMLVDTPTARLERLLIEHLDLCTYRLDAWRQGVFQMQLEFMRTQLGSRPAPVATNAGNVPATNRAGDTSRGIYLGAYGWLENVRPREAQLAPANVPPELRTAFDIANRPVVDDPDNLGYIHAPSLDQAQTAAILRSTYVNNADPENAKTTGVNLTSWRVRQAMTVLEGLRNDQSLGELLGYRLERELHDNFELAETDEYIFALRRHFPLVANRNTKSYQDLQPGESIETIEARNVVDGERLIQHIEDSGDESYPFGLSDMPAASAAQLAKIDGAVDRLRNVADAVADLAMAESVHQALKGKPDSAAATLDAHGSGLFPPVSEFVATPREGIAITSRTAIFLDPAPAAGSAWPGLPQTVRGAAEPAIGHWLASLCPQPDDVFVRVRNETAVSETDISLADLGLQPLDWFYDLKLDDRQSLATLDVLIEEHYRRTQAPVGPRDSVTIHYDQAPADKISLFELAPLFESARQLVTKGRELRSSDIALNNDSRAEREGGAPELPRARADDALSALVSLESDAQSFAAAITPDLDDPVANEASLRANFALRLSDFAPLAQRARAFGFKELDAMIGIRWKRQWFTDLDNRLQELIADWHRRLDDFHGYIARFDAVPPGAAFNDVFLPLQRAERQISTTVTSPMPDDPATMRADLASRVQLFEAKLAELEAVVALGTDDADQYLTQLEAALPLTDFVPEDFDIAAAQMAFAAPTGEMVAGIEALLVAAAKRRGAAQAKLDSLASAQPDAQAKLVIAALQAVFGEEFVALPSFTLTAEQQAELALCEGDKVGLIRHERDTLGDPDPIDTWWHGVARVRDQMASLEYLSMAREALTGSDVALDAWQLPHEPDAHWVGASYPPEYAINGDRLLFQAVHSVPFAPATAQVGILIDEWTEVIPTENITTGVAFHFDQPNSEPPQSFLLMTPTDFRGGWTWDDVIDGLNETLDAAKRRAVEPEHIDQTPYALFVPATIASTLHHPLSIMLNYAVVNNFARVEAQEVN
ncbi:hypothetical protein [Aurantiacibacter sp. MUD61]|uniref:hypothetical protein n=1 Tax=Aurantiacibacter sp. MUD61 TaxID=3009083 RepID=UPI0022F13FCD|nr:hypothetical protein [Aurantiacibacter sp. MUD61]